MLNGAQEKEYIGLLPVMYQIGETGEFVTRFLKGFEAILAGRRDHPKAFLNESLIAGDESSVAEDKSPITGLEEIVNRIYDYFSPETTPDTMLPWLASWVALSLKMDDEWNTSLDVSGAVEKINPLYAEERSQLLPYTTGQNTKNRSLLKRIMKLYRIRGTKGGLEEYLQIFTGTRSSVEMSLGEAASAESSNISVDIIENAGPFQVGTDPSQFFYSGPGSTIGVNTIVGHADAEYHGPFKVGVDSSRPCGRGAGSTVGVNTVIGGLPPYYFQVHMKSPKPQFLVVKEKSRLVREIIDREKPAFTYYTLHISMPSMQVGVFSTVGKDTLLWKNY